MDKQQVRSVLAKVIPLSVNDGYVERKKTVQDTSHIGVLSGNRLNSGTLRSQFIVFLTSTEWDNNELSAKRALHSDQRVFVQTGEDIWDVYRGVDLTENNDPVLIRKGVSGLADILAEERMAVLSQYAAANPSHVENIVPHVSLQVIIYGAPGTGKSYVVKQETGAWKDNVFRTTFHPDSDYSTFVGAYKPSMSENAGRVEVYKGVGESKVLDATHEVKKGISYEFIPQAFIKAYVLAWKKMSEAPNGDDGKPNPEPVFLVIEEINRGNCAQIFGDIFQLLDRNEAGYSDYPISADADLKKFLSRTKSEGGIGDIDAGVISTRYGIDSDEVELIRDGRHLMLPPNLLIRATMNTSDQSLFPIDSAFKRRWDWKYVPISKPDKAKDPAWKDRKIEVGDTLYDWWEFLQLINNHIYKATESEDKQLGYFFVKADSATGYISAEKFVNKVLFYLYGDVFRSYELPKKDCFGELKYKDFFFKGVDGGHLPGEVNTDKLKEFLDNLKWEGVGVKSEPISKAPKTEGE